MNSCPKFEICEIQSELLALKLEVQLFNSLIENKIKEIKEAKIDDPKDDSHCNFLMCFVNNLDEQCKFEKAERSRKDTTGWIFNQIFLALPTKKYSSFWPIVLTIFPLWLLFCSYFLLALGASHHHHHRHHHHHYHHPQHHHPHAHLYPLHRVLSQRLPPAIVSMTLAWCTLTPPRTTTRRTRIAICRNSSFSSLRLRRSCRLVSKPQRPTPRTSAESIATTLRAKGRR